jgi:hypothetical protein
VAANSDAVRVIDIRGTSAAVDAEDQQEERRGEGCRFLTGHSAIVLCVAVRHSLPRPPPAAFSSESRTHVRLPRTEER